MLITMIFILAGIAFMIGTLVYVKGKNNMQDFKATEKTSSHTKKTISNLWGIENINNQVVSLNNGQKSIIVELESIEYNLLHDGEKNSVNGELISICQMLEFPIQFLEIKQRINMEDSIDRIRTSTFNSNKYIKVYARNIIEHLEKIQDTQDLFERKNYMIISSYNKLKIADTELKEFYQTLRGHLLNINVSSRILNDDEILELVYKQLHKESKSKVKDLVVKGGLDLYVTSNRKRKKDKSV